MAEHDQRFKALLREFLREFLELFFPGRAAGLDLSHIDWLDKEILTAPPEGDVFILDLVARVMSRPPADGSGTALATVLLLEVESRDAVATFRERIYHYYEGARRKHPCRVLPMALYLNVGLDGIGIDTYVETYEDLEILRFQFHYVGLPALDAERYVAGDNWLGVALSALMRIPEEKRVWLRAEALRRVLLECPENPFRRLLLCECIEAYLTLNDEQQMRYEELLRTPEYEEMIPVMTTTFEKGVEKGVLQGLEKGAQQGQRRLIRLQLEKKFGPLSTTVEQRLNDASAERLEELGLILLEAPSIQALGLED